MHNYRNQLRNYKHRIHLLKAENRRLKQKQQQLCNENDILQSRINDFGQGQKITKIQEIINYLCEIIILAFITKEVSTNSSGDNLAYAMVIALVLLFINTSINCFLRKQEIKLMESSRYLLNNIAQAIVTLLGLGLFLYFSDDVQFNNFRINNEDMAGMLIAFIIVWIIVIIVISCASSAIAKIIDYIYSIIKKK